jgi:hypothetical protein
MLEPTTAGAGRHQAQISPRAMLEPTPAVASRHQAQISLRAME